MKTLLSLTVFLLIIIADISIGDKLSHLPKDRPPFAATNHQRIVGGYNATAGQFKYQAALYVSPTNAFCGGSVISREWVLTAAHCIYRADGNYTIDIGAKRFTNIVFGFHNLDTYPPAEPNRIDKTAKKLIPHELFQPTGYLNDIGLVMFEAFTFNSGIVPIASATATDGNF